MPLLLVDGSWFSWEFLISWRWKTLMLSMAWKDEGSGMAPLSSSVTFQRLLLQHKKDKKWTKQAREPRSRLDSKQQPTNLSVKMPEPQHKRSFSCSQLRGWRIGDDGALIIRHFSTVLLSAISINGKSWMIIFDKVSFLFFALFADDCTAMCETYQWILWKYNITL